MSVNVRIPTILRTYTGGRSEVPAEGATLAEVIADLEKNHSGIAARVLDDQGKLRRFVNVYVNDDDVRFEQGLETATPDGAGISIIPAVMRRLLSPLARAANPRSTELPSPLHSPRGKRRGQFCMVERGRVGEQPPAFVPGAYEPPFFPRRAAHKVPRPFAPLRAFCRARLARNSGASSRFRRFPAPGFLVRLTCCRRQLGRYIQRRSTRSGAHPRPKVGG